MTIESKNFSNYKSLAGAIRTLSMDAVQKANSGHPGMPLGMADVATVLFKDFLKFNPKDPDWIDRDRFILSAGHGSMLIYSLLYLTGYEDITIDEIKNFRQLHAKTAGHPEYGHAKGIETTTGPLGQGLANSVGFALAEAILESNFGKELIDHYTYVIAGDGCLMEGISHEAISLAGHLGLSKLIVLFDDNDITIDGPTSLSVSDDQLKRFEASNWDVQQIDGHNPEEIYNAINNAKASNKPSLIACKTTIGFGSPNKSGKSSSHGSPLGEEEITKTKDILGLDQVSFKVPEDILKQWKEIGNNSIDAYNEWQNIFKSSSQASELERRFKGELPEIANILKSFKERMISEAPKIATRAASGKVLEEIVDLIPEIIGGSADLTGSNLTKTKTLEPITKEDKTGKYIYYGIREHAMAACMNGLSLHGGFIPFGGTFLVFADYCRPSIRLSALMKQRVIYVMTHDSIGLGEDGPTHQPVEHLASLRAIPNLDVIRPADMIETIEAWEIALNNLETPTLLALTRQGLPCLRKDSKVNKSKYGAYRLIENAKAQISIFATGSEVEIAVKAHEKLKELNIESEIISAPSLDIFDKQDRKYQDDLLGSKTIKVAIEAALDFGWHKYIGRDGIFIGMDNFGASAPADELYEYFEISASKLVNEVLKRIK